MWQLQLGLGLSSYPSVGAIKLSKADALVQSYTALANTCWAALTIVNGTSGLTMGSEGLKV